MKKTLSIFSAMVFAGFGFVAPALANENEEGLVSNGIEVSEIIERTEIPELYENTTTVEVKTHPDHQEISVGAYLGEEYVDGEALVPEYKENSAVFDFSEVELKAGDKITFYIQDGIVFSEEFVRTVQPAEEEGDNTYPITLADFNLPELNEDTTIYEVEAHPDTTIRAYFGEVAPETEFLDSEYVDGSTYFDFSDRELEVGETVIFYTSDGLQFEERIERTVQPAEEATEETPEETPGEISEEGGELPDTATNTPMMLALSVSLIVAGGALLIVRRRKSYNM